MIQRILALHDFDPSNLRLEVSEDAVVDDLERTVEVQGPVIVQARLKVP